MVDVVDDRELATRLLALATQTRQYFPRGHCLGLEPADVQVLLALSLRAPQAVGELAETLALTQPTVSHCLDRLVSGRLVRQTADKNDCRRRFQSLTRSGERRVAQFLALARARSG